MYLYIRDNVCFLEKKNQSAIVTDNTKGYFLFFSG